MASRSIARAVQPTLSKPACRAFSSTSASLAGRQGGRFRKPEKKFDVAYMEKFEFDDQTTIGHELFENIRTVRQYLRKTEYELPKLQSKRKKNDNSNVMYMFIHGNVESSERKKEEKRKKERKNERGKGKANECT